VIIIDYKVTRKPYHARALKCT